ncbi:hypothetical protein [Anaerobaca lacustris]|uniref:Uncharacterized protein n=1 Tax=Anaerobaca lacustris TaxID=3044600 RepID=A0AAW6TZB9_9BACT|nr:hypothetical protein [Sedimentisphaerales bacterium M17dextr]
MSRFVICIDNESNPASLILGKVYRVLPDADAETHNMVRIVDEDKSEPDGYLYPAPMFAPIKLPEEAERALTASDR